MSKRVLVTGASGFIGAALLPALGRAGHQVATYDVGEGDISRDPLELNGVEHVFHLAAKTFIPDSWRDPFSYYQVNVMGTLNVLEACRRAGSSVTLMSTYLYGVPLRLPIAEDHPLDPTNPYSHGKAMMESLGAFYSAKFRLNVTVLRLFNIFGPGQREEFLIPSIVSQVLDPAAAWIEVADLEPRRDYLYIDDLVAALLATLENPRSFGLYNIGSGMAFSVGEVIAAVQQAAGTNKPVRSRGERRPGEVLETLANTQRARAELNWEPVVSFGEGIRRVVAAARGGKA
jgi:UDP-glucose 4-epimerase